MKSNTKIGKNSDFYRKNFFYSLNDIVETYNINIDTYKTHIKRLKNNNEISCKILNDYFGVKNIEKRRYEIPFPCSDFFYLLYSYFFNSPEYSYYKTNYTGTRKYHTQFVDFIEYNKSIIKLVKDNCKRTTKHILYSEPSYIFVINTLKYIPKFSDAIYEIVRSLFEIDEATANFAYELLLNKLYIIIDLLQEQKKISKKTDQDTNKYYSLLNAFVRGYDRATELNANGLLPTQYTTKKDENKLDKKISRTIPLMKKYNYYSLIQKYMYSYVLIPHLCRITNNTPGNLYTDYNMQQLIEWIYIYGNQFDVNNLLKTISEINKILYQFVDVYNKLEIELTKFFQDNSKIHDYNKQLDECINFWTSHKEFNICFGKQCFFGINNLFDEKINYSDKLPEEILKELDFKEAIELMGHMNSLINNMVKQKKHNVNLSEDKLCKIHNLYKCYIATWGCYIVSVKFQEYVNCSRKAKNEYLSSKTKMIKNHVNIYLKDSIAKTFEEAWIDKIHSSLKNENKYFSVKNK